LMGVIGKVQASVDKGLDALINWIVTMARKLGRFVAQAGLPQDPKERARLGIQAARNAVNRFAGKQVGRVVLEPVLIGVKARYGFTVLELKEKGQKWSLSGVLNPIVGVDTDAEVTGIIPFNPITSAEAATIGAIPGGINQLNKLQSMIAGKAQQSKIDAETGVIRTVLALIAQGNNIAYIGQDLWAKGDVERYTEIDILTSDEMIEVKTGDYSKERKLPGGRDMTQFTNHKRFFEGKVKLFDTKGGIGNIIKPPKRWIYQFTKPISPELYAWLKEKGVTEVRTAR
jgi:hypothetical protein